MTLSPSRTLGAERSLPNHMHDLTFWNFNQSDNETQWLNWDWCAHRSAPLRLGRAPVARTLAPP